MNTPTRDDLARLLHSDPSSDNWATEARDALAALKSDESEVDAARDLIDMVAGDVQVALMSIDQDSRRPEILMTDADELERLAYIAKCGAIKMLHAAFAAEQALGKLEGAA